MSFSQKVKIELSEKTDIPNHCRDAQLAAMLLRCATESEDSDNKVCLTFEGKITFDVIKTLLVKQYARDKDARTLIGKDFSDYKREIIVEDEYLVKLLSAYIRNCNKYIKKECCKRAFLRGAFLCGGSVNDPEGLYHFEIVCDKEKLANIVRKLFADFEIVTKVIERKSRLVVYLKEGSNIADALNLLGAVNSQMDFYNVMIVKDMRNDINRRVNCETANLKKTVSAAVEQIKDIEFIRDTIGLNYLNENLRSTAMLRLENPDASLKALGEMTEPQISRSGINNRLKAIAKIAEEHRKNTKE